MVGNKSRWRGLRSAYCSQQGSRYDARNGDSECCSSAMERSETGITWNLELGVVAFQNRHVRESKLKVRPKSSGFQAQEAAILRMRSKQKAMVSAGAYSTLKRKSAYGLELEEDASRRMARLRINQETEDM